MMLPDENLLILKWTAGWKYQVAETVTWELRHDFKPNFPVSNRYYRLWTHEGRWFITAHVGCCWDGPTWFPDFIWMMLASLIHDILHWLIAAGAINVIYNDLIDAELGGIIRMQKQRLSNLRAWYVERATNKVDQKIGETKKIFTYELQLT